MLDKIYEQKQHRENEEITNRHEIFVSEEREERMVVGGNSGVNNGANRLNNGLINDISTSVRMQDETGHKGNPIAAIPSTLTAATTANPFSSASKGIKQTAKERFYARADYVRNKRQKEQEIQENIDRYKEEYRVHIDRLRGELRFNAESVALDLLGKSNSKLSTRTILKYGSKGSLAIRISGSKAGTWYDFEKGEGGDLFDLVQQEKRCDFKEAVEYISDRVGLSRNRSSNIVHLYNISDRYIEQEKEQVKEQAIEKAKIKKAQDLYARSKVITSSSVAAKYLTTTRKIDISANANGKSDHSADSSALLGSDIRTCNIYDETSDKRLPAIVAFARNKSGEITGGQQILLDSNTLNKADIAVPKKSFGKIAGSFVEISKTDSNNITIIAEGLETALSVKQAGLDARIICSLGIHNIKNYVPKAGERIIIAADNDGEKAASHNTIIEATKLLEASSLAVRVVKPQQLGDFNDILQKQGSRAGAVEIREIFRPVMEELADNKLSDTIKQPAERSQVVSASDSRVFEHNKSVISQSHDGKLNSEFALRAYNKVKEHVDAEIDSARNNNLIAKKINLNNLKSIAVNYAFDKLQSQEFKPLSIEQTKALVSRSLFEINNRQRINDILNGAWNLENPNIPKPLSYILQCERLTDKLTKVSGYLVENIVLKNPEKHLSIKRDDSIIRQAYRISETRGTKLQEIIKNDPIIKEMAPQHGSDTQQAVAHQLVDYRLQHGMDVNITNWKLESMQESAKLEQELSKPIESKLNKALTPSFIRHNTDSSEQHEALSEAKKLVVHHLRKDIDEQHHILKFDKQHCDIAVNKSIKMIDKCQQAINRQHLEEIQHSKMHQGNGVGMSI